MTQWLMLDIAACVILILSFVIMSGKGIVKCIYKIASIAATIILVAVLTEPASNILASTGVGIKIDEMVYNALIPDKDYNDETGSVETTDEEESVHALPKFLEQSVSNVTGGALAPTVSDLIKKLISAVAVYFIVKLVLYLVFMLIEGIFSLPVLNGANRLLGGCIGLLSGIILIYILCGVLSLNVSNSMKIREVIDKTYIVKYFYDYNILMNLFLKK